MSKTKLTNSEYKRKLEHQIYMAQEHPAKIYDLTDCNINQIPRGVFTYCKVLRKYSLNLSENSLQSLQSGGNLEDLSYLGVLILSRNLFKSLQLDILKLTNLKKLYLDYNKFQKFPLILFDLPNLKILNLEGNSIKVVPKEISNFKNLENLNLLKNPLNSIAPEICETPKINVLLINLEQVKNVSNDILALGFHELWRYFCAVRKVPFRKININISEFQDDSEFQKSSQELNSNLRYTKIGDEIEREILEHERHVSLGEIEDRRKSMDEIKKKIQQENEMISAILSQKQTDNDRLLDAIKYEEINSNELISRIFEYNNRAKKKEELRNRIAEMHPNYVDFDFTLSRESKNQVLNSMKQLLESSSDPWKKRCYFLDNYNDSSKNISMTPFTRQMTFEGDSEQKLAFKQLQLDKDAQLCRLRDGMEIIEKKLQQLSVEDMIEGSLATDFNRTNRAHLVKVLQELKREKEARELVLDEKTDQIEGTRVSDQENFWIVQYQNLLDDKAKSEYEIQEFLKMADMTEWIPVFLKYGYTIDSMLDITMEDLDQLDITSDIVKNKFISFLNEWKFNPIKSGTDSKPSAPTYSYFENEKNRSESSAPSAPPLSISSNIGIGTSVPNENAVVLARKEAECCICLTLEARILLLNCGHVCCCKECSFAIKECPLCRQRIIQRVNLEFSI